MWLLSSQFWLLYLRLLVCSAVYGRLRFLQERLLLGGYSFMDLCLLWIITPLFFFFMWKIVIVNAWLTCHHHAVEETVDHLLPNCMVAQEIWRSVLQWFYCSWCSLFLLTQHFSCCTYNESISDWSSTSLYDHCLTYHSLPQWYQLTYYSSHPNNCFTSLPTLV